MPRDDVWTILILKNLNWNYTNEYWTIFKLDITSSNFTKSSIEVDEDFGKVFLTTIIILIIIIRPLICTIFFTDSGYMASHNKLSQNYDFNDTNPAQMNCESELDDSHPNQFDTQMLTQTAYAVEQTLNGKRLLSFFNHLFFLCYCIK